MPGDQPTVARINAKQCDQAKELIDAKSLIIMDALRRDTNNHSRLSLNQMSSFMGGDLLRWFHLFV